MQEENTYYIEERIWANKENIKNANQIEIAAFGIFPLLTSVILSAYELPRLAAGISLCGLFVGTILLLRYLRLKGKGFKRLGVQLYEFKMGKIAKEPHLTKGGKTRIILILAIASYISSLLVAIAFVFLGY